VRDYLRGQQPVFLGFFRDGKMAYIPRRRKAPIREQGTKMSRHNTLHVQIHRENAMNGIEVGGYVTPLTEAKVRL
jgi:predicted PhzF superfamily epimerase YddE/YHI9